MCESDQNKESWSRFTLYSYGRKVAEYARYLQSWVLLLAPFLNLYAAFKYILFFIDI